MRFEVLCVSKRPAAWVLSANEEYLTRLQGKLAVQCRELNPYANASTPAQQRDKEGEMIHKALPGDATLVALDERGEQWTTRELADHLSRWRNAARDVVFVIGGAEGLSATVQTRASHTWGLSHLTLPHQLARVIVVEQIYRAWSLLQGHPYHRA
jgi:23S rRNA (pseudouridine1915-N3)-methyltransferase